MLRLLLAEAGAGLPGKGVSMPQEMAPEMETLKARLKATWMSGDYGTFAKYLEPSAIEFLERISVPAGGSAGAPARPGRRRGPRPAAGAAIRSLPMLFGGFPAGRMFARLGEACKTPDARAKAMRTS